MNPSNLPLPLLAAGIPVLLLLLLPVLIFFLPVRLYFLYDDDITLRLKVLGFSFPLYPKKKKWKMKDHLPQRKRTKKRPDEKPTQSKPTVPEKEKKAEKPSKEKPIAEKIEEFYGFTSRLLDRVIFPLIERLGKHLTVRISRFEVIIGSENAAKSALLYSAAVNCGYALFSLIDNCARLQKVRHGRIYVSCPFTESKSSILCEMELGIHLYGALFTLLPAIYTYLTEFTEQNPSLHQKRKENMI